MNLQSFKIFIDHEIQYSNKKIEEFKRHLDVNPLSALTWSLPIFNCAAKKFICERIQTMLDKSNEDMQVIKDFLSDEVQYRARSLSRSTSQVSNLMEESMLSAYAYLLDQINRS